MADTEKRNLLPANIEKLEPYVAGKTIAEVREMYRPDEISKLASNENRLGCSPAVEQAVHESLKEIQDYPDPVSRRLRAALAEKAGLSAANIFVAAGSESIIAILCRTFFAAEDEALSADVTFVGFFVQANIQGIKVRKVPLTPDYRFNAEAMMRAVTDQTKMIYIANPNNPTGTYITKNEFERLMEAVPDDVLVVMDEAYYEYAAEAEDYPHAIEYNFDNVLSLRTFSKAYGLAGLRVGYAAGPERLISSMMKTKLTFEPSATAQAAALASLGDDDFLSRSKQVVKNGGERLYNFFDDFEVEYVRSASNSVLMICRNEAEAETFTQHMLEKGVILRQVSAFGLPNCVRITIGTEQEMDHFERSFKELKDKYKI
jgi:histidinol-phosphate aminotransferase